MAIPKPCESEQVIAAREYFQRVGVEGLEQLSEEDALLLGNAILMFSFNELNMRKTVELFCEKGLVKRKEYFRTIDLVGVVKNGITKALPSGSQLEDDLAKLDEIEFRRPFRNMFSHWAAKRLKGMDSIVFMTMDTRDSEAANGLNTITPTSITFSVMMLDDIRNLLGDITNQGEWLALRAREWHLVIDSPTCQ